MVLPLARAAAVSTGLRILAPRLGEGRVAADLTWLGIGIGIGIGLGLGLGIGSGLGLGLGGRGRFAASYRVGYTRTGRGVLGIGIGLGLELGKG